MLYGFVVFPNIWSNYRDEGLKSQINTYWMHLKSTRFSPSPESQTFSKHTLVRKSRTSAKIFFTCHGQVIPSFFKSRKRHDKAPRFGGAVSVFVCAVRVFVCAVRVLVCAVSILFVLWAIWFWCEVFVVVAINLLLLWVICCCCDSCGPPYLWSLLETKLQLHISYLQGKVLLFPTYFSKIGGGGGLKPPFDYDAGLHRGVMVGGKHWPLGLMF